MTRDVDAIRADLAARTVGGMASSAADRDIAALLGVIDGLRKPRTPRLRRPALPPCECGCEDER